MTFEALEEKQLSSPSNHAPSPASLPLSKALEKSGDEPVQDSYTTLLKSTELEQLFARYPQLKSQLTSIYTATLEPSQEDQENDARRWKRATRGRGRGRGRGNTYDSPVPWTRERGLKDAMRQLRNVRRVEGQQGEGLREFSALVTKTYEDIAPLAQARGPLAELPPLDFLDGAA
ncbi:hypothetical protein MMC11_007199 [Xylographa trunciseda]|nr:hypothetical protein [Xylographa trunciseda]